MNKISSYLVLSVLAVILPFLFITLPFEIPDENAHYSSLNFLNNEGRMPTKYDKQNLSKEEMDVEKIFGVMERENLYSFHPEYRIEQVSGPIGKYENLIKSLNTEENRYTYTVHQAALYPPLFYVITLPFFKLVETEDILLRIFVSRFPSVVLTTLVVLISYFIGLEIFKKRSSAITLAFMTLFFPMTTYIGSGINSDNLHNFLFALATLVAIKLIRNGLSRNLSLSIGVIIGLDLITKPQAYILLPIFVLAVIVRWRFNEWKEVLMATLYVLLPVLIIAGWQEVSKFISSESVIPQGSAYGGWENFIVFARGYIRTHITEMPVWYWGVFKWFGVLLPKPLWWIGTRLIGLSVIGLIIQFLRDCRSHRLSQESKYILFALGANLIYILSLFWFDWQFYREVGRSLGLQPRYYLPLLIAQMSLILIGLTNLSWNSHSKEWIRKGIIVFFISLQLSSFYVQLSSYYDLNSLSVFINQISQYKPFFAKGNWWYIWLPLYFTGIITTSIITLKSDSKK